MIPAINLHSRIIFKLLRCPEDILNPFSKRSKVNKPILNLHLLYPTYPAALVKENYGTYNGIFIEVKE
jgi:hypothetical protein